MIIIASAAGAGLLLLSPASAGDIPGGDGNDHLVGSPYGDTIRGFGGNDILEGRDGADWIWGDDGDDQLYGGLGHDFLMGGIGSDELYGDEGADTFELGDGKDIVHAGPGDDLIKNLSVDQGPYLHDGGLVWSAPDHVDCGAGFDTVDVTTIDTYDTFAGCEQII